MGRRRRLSAEPPTEAAPCDSGLRWLATEPPLGFLVAERAYVPSDFGWLSAGELEVLRGLRLPKRRADWLLGRWAAKKAVLSYQNELNGITIGASVPESAVAIVAAADGAPEVVFAERGAAAPVRVSIAHSAGRALAVVGPGEAVFGADIEVIEARSPGFIEDFFTAAEQAWVGSLEEGERAFGACLVWSAKEAVLKALRVGLREDTRAVEIEVPDVAMAPATLPPSAGATRLDSASSEWRPIGARMVATGRQFKGAARVDRGQVLAVLAGWPPFISA